MIEFFVGLLVVTPFVVFPIYVQYKFAKLSKLYFKLLDPKVDEKVYLFDTDLLGLPLKYGLGELLKSQIPSNSVIDKKLQTKENEGIILRRKKVCEEVNNLIIIIILLPIIGFFLFSIFKYFYPPPF